MLRPPIVYTTYVWSPCARYKGTWDCLSTSVRNEGAGVMYKGLVGTILREVPGTAAWFGAYETFVEVRPIVLTMTIIVLTMTIIVLTMTIIVLTMTFVEVRGV